MKVKLPANNKEISVSQADVLAPDEAVMEKKRFLEKKIASAEKQILSDRSFNRLESILRRDFTPEKIKGYIQALCEANDIRSSDGQFYESPNWAARNNGLKEVLNLLRYTQMTGEVTRDSVPAKIVFNIVNAVPKEKEAA